MTFKKFYEEIENINIEEKEKHKIYTKYTKEHEQILALIAKLEASKSKNFDNLKHKYLPKKLTFDATIITAVISRNIRFLSENKKYKKTLEAYDKHHYIGYYTTNVTAIFYNENNKSFKQFSLPKKGILIPQNEDIEVIKNNSKRQKRSDTKYKKLEYVEDIRTEEENLIKQLYIISLIKWYNNET